MKGGHHILVATQNRVLAENLRDWLDAEGYTTILADTYAAAKVHLDLQPAAIIASVKLGEYNGLHLAIRAKTNQIPALIVGERDCFFLHEAEHLGATYIAIDELNRERVLSFVDAHAQDHHDTTQIAWIDHGTVASLRERMVGLSGLDLPGGRRLRVN